MSARQLTSPKEQVHGGSAQEPHDDLAKDKSEVLKHEDEDDYDKHKEPMQRQMSEGLLTGVPSKGKPRVAFITGITGQDGSYLTELLLGKGYAVHGLVRNASYSNTTRLHKILTHQNLHLHVGDITDASALAALIARLRPDEVYHLAGQTQVAASLEMPGYTAQVNAIGTLNVLEAIRGCGLTHKCRFFNASTGELFGTTSQGPMNEQATFHPLNPYAVSKLYAHWITVHYREAYCMFACNGILFSHESARRGGDFVSKKIVRGAARIKHHKQDVLLLGNLKAMRDWGHAKDFAYGIWLILQAGAAEDWVLATGSQHSVKEFCEMAFGYVGMQLEWSGTGVNEVGYNAADPSKTPIIRVDPEYCREAEVDSLLGDATKAREKLKWETTFSFADLVKNMMNDQLDAVASGRDEWTSM